MSTLKDAIKKLAKEGDTASILLGTVSAVDKDARTVDVEPINEDAPILGVNLQANQESTLGVVQFPREGSYVAVAMLSGYEAGVVVLTDDVESIEVNINDGTKLTLTEDGISLNVKDGITLDIDDKAAVFNGGDLGGLIKIEELTNKINALVNTVNALIDNYNAHTHITTATVSASPTPGVISPIVAPALKAQTFKAKDYEDDKVKH